MFQERPTQTFFFQFCPRFFFRRVNGGEFCTGRALLKTCKTLLFTIGLLSVHCKEA